MTITYIVSVPVTPGAAPSNIPCVSIASARKIAASYSHRRDLTYQDVVIRLLPRNGGPARLVEYAGPSR
jgi:hypothetical protein